MQCDDILGGANCAIFIGFGKAVVPVKGITLYVDLSSFLLYFTTASGVPGVGGDGSVTFPIPLPNDPAAVGVEIDAQIVPLDLGVFQKLSASPGLTFNMCDTP